MATVSTQQFADEIVHQVKTMAREHAINGNKDGFQVTISADDVKESTGRVRVQDSILERIGGYLEGEGLNVEVDLAFRSITVISMPILRSEYNLKALRDCVSVVEEVRERELHLMDAS